MARILIIDDDRMMRDLLAARVIKMAHKATVAGTISEALALAAARRFDLVFLDVRLPDGNGLDLLPTIRNLPYHPEVIIITGVGDDAGAELAIRSGAWDYLQKPFAKGEIVLQINRALDFRREKRSETKIRLLKRDDLIGSSPAFSVCLDQAARCAAGETNVLITGETGTGKEVFARTIHRNSDRAQSAFVVVDCAALPDRLVESILFGHEKGAFTGADRSRSGLLKQADGGTLFLDEIGELPLAVQRAFLRALQEKRFRPVGSERETTSDFRIVAATHRQLEQMVESGGFRKDLLYRLRTVEIHLPPLRERKEDLANLAFYHMGKLSGTSGCAPKGMVPEFIEALNAYHWPGNVRELVNVIEETLAGAPEAPVLFPLHLPAQIRIHYTQSAMARKRAVGDNGMGTDSIDPAVPLPSYKTFRTRALDQVEARYLHRLMQDSNFEIDRAMAVSGLGKSRLYALLRKHRIGKTA